MDSRLDGTLIATILWETAVLINIVDIFVAFYLPLHSPPLLMTLLMNEINNLKNSHALLLLCGIIIFSTSLIIMTIIILLLVGNNQRDRGVVRSRGWRMMKR